MIKTLNPKNLKDLRDFVLNNKHILVSGAETSTVIPFMHDKTMKDLFKDTVKLSLQSIKPQIKLQGKIVTIEGAVTWKSLRENIEAFDLDVPFWPTDQEAFVLSGLATSATGERSFHYGNIKNYVESISVMDSSGETHIYHGSDSIEELFSQDDLDCLTQYNQEFSKYKKFKNGPFPIIENPVDLFLGSEGQLGIITSCELRLIPKKETVHLLYPIGEWEKSDDLSRFSLKASECRDFILSCEFFDKNSVELNPDLPLRKLDHIAFEVLEDKLEEFICEMDLEEDFIRIISERKFHELRVAIPHGINEYMSQNGLTKKGTDVQVTKENFKELVSLYRNLAKQGVPYVLFGHLGDQHLHFNFLCQKETEQKCLELLGDFYKEVQQFDSSPFAEHGIGVLKKDFIKSYHNKASKNFFEVLKNKFDPQNKFFPQGYMSDN